MAPMYSYLADNISVMPIYYWGTKLLANKIGNGQVCVDSKKSISPHQVFKVQSHYTSKLFGYSAIIDIVKQQSIIFSILTRCMNLRLIQALQFLCQFYLNVCYKPSKDNIVPNALLQLMSANTGKLLPMHNELHVLLTIEVNFTATIVQINIKL